MDLSHLTVPLTPNPEPEDIFVRLAATVLASALIGYNRERGGHAAGFRTTILVGLAACLSMIEGNILLSTPVAAEASEVVRLDVLRLALGTLTGVGFIGAGAIMHKGDLVTGVTTAATLWVITAIGICFGGGQIALGALATLIAFFVLSPMKYVSSAFGRREKALVTLRQAVGQPLPELSDLLKPLGVTSCFISREVDGDTGSVLLTYEIGWRDTISRHKPSQLIDVLTSRHDLVRLNMATTEL
jgi:putative Mg2+ transporter-C (MgtC) family protein